jgi:hypothetical protein
LNIAKTNSNHKTSFYAKKITRHFIEPYSIKISLKFKLKKGLKPFLLVCFTVLSICTWGQRTASVSGNWSSTATWGGNPVPTSTDAVIINSGIAVTVDVNAFCTSITFSGTSATGSTLTVNNGVTLTMSGNITLNGAAGNNTAATISGVGSITGCTGIIIAPTDPTVSSNIIRTYILTSEISSLNLNGNLTINNWQGGNANRLGQSSFNLNGGTTQVHSNWGLVMYYLMKDK